MRDRADDDADEGHNVAADKEPAAAKEVGEAAEDGVGKGEGQRACNVDPGCVVGRANVLVDVAEDVGGQDDKEVRRDGGEAEALESDLARVGREGDRITRASVRTRRVPRKLRE